MDILTHALSAACTGSIAAVCCKSFKYRVTAIAASVFAGVLPDIDAISMWSGFNRTCGEWFGLTEAGRDIYYGVHWYSHHGFVHSLCAALLFSLVIWLAVRWRNRAESKWVAFAFAIGYVTHLVGDMITPGGPWHGIRLFFPSAIYIGGSGSVWWWNNYDIFLITLFFATLTSGIVFWGKSRLKNRLIFGLCIGWLIGVAAVASTRHHDFNTGEYEKNELYSKEVQQKHLPAPIYRSMEAFDRWLKPMF